MAASLAPSPVRWGVMHAPPGAEIISQSDLREHEASLFGEEEGLSLNVPLDGIWERWSDQPALHVRDVSLQTTRDLQLLYGAVVEPAVRNGMPVTIASAVDLDDLDDSQFREPIGYAWTLQRLRWLIDQPVTRTQPSSGDHLQRLDPAQRRAATAQSGVVQIIAPAGSGKTTVLVARVRELLSRGADPSTILCLTFNRDARLEMDRRLGAAGIDRVRAHTYHSLGLSLLREAGLLRADGGNLGSPSLAQWRMLAMRAQQACGSDGVYIAPFDAASGISDLKLGRQVAAAEHLADLPSDADPMQRTLAHLYDQYEQWLSAESRHDFDDLIVLLLRALRDRPDLRETWQMRFRHLLVDEFQDTEPAQEAIAFILAAPQDSLFLVGDEDQCQPAGTKVLTDRGEVAIEDLNADVHRLVSCNLSTDALVGFQEGCAFRKASRRYSGPMLTVNAGSRSTRCTPDHRWPVRWSKTAAQQHVVCLVLQGSRWRLTSGRLVDAANQQEADAGWMLRAFARSAEARDYASLLATNYGLLTVPQPTDSSTELAGGGALPAASQLDVADHARRASRCLADHGRDRSFPLWRGSGRDAADGQDRTFELRACNLLPEVMDVLVRCGEEQAAWHPVDVSSVDVVDVVVFSIAVEPHRTYVADAIVTHNCLYSWRRATVERSLQVHRSYPGVQRVALQTNYRCPREVVEVSRRIIARNRRRFRKPINPFYGRAADPDAVLHLAYGDLGEGAGVIARRLARSTRGEIAVLARTTRMLRTLAEACVPYGVRLDGPDAVFVPRGARAAVEAYLRLLADSRSARAEDVAVICRAPNRSLPMGGEEPVAEALRRGATFSQAMTTVQAVGRAADRLLEAGQILDRLIPANDAGRTLRLLRTDGGLDRHFKEYEQTFGGTEAVELETLDQLCHEAAGRRLDDFASDLTRRSEALADLRDPAGGVEITTVHRAKGREWPLVVWFGADEDESPHRASIEEDRVNDNWDGLEGERRVAYVATTRSREKLVIVSSTRRASRFLVDAGLVQRAGRAAPASSGRRLTPRRDYVNRSGHTVDAAWVMTDLLSADVLLGDCDSMTSSLLLAARMMRDWSSEQARSAVGTMCVTEIFESVRGAGTSTVARLRDALPDDVRPARRVRSLTDDQRQAVADLLEHASAELRDPKP